MIKIHIFLYCFLFFQSVFSQLNGVYSIGVELSDYETIDSAVSDLIINGVSGPVVFNIKDGVYQNGINNIPEIEGSSSINTITFQSESLNANNVTLTGLLYLFSKNIIINKLSFEKQNPSYNSGRRSILFNGDSENIEVRNCIFNNSSAVSSDYYNNYGSKSGLSFISFTGGADLKILNNSFWSTGSAIYGYSANNLTIENNILEGRMVTPISLRSCTNTAIKSNEFKGEVRYESVSAVFMKDELIIDANKIYSTNDDLILPYYFSINSKSAMNITCSSSGGALYLINNFLSVKNGIHIDSFKNAFISNNSFNSTEGQCLIIDEISDLENIELHNNIFYTNDEEDQALKISRGVDLSKLTSTNNVFQKEENAIGYAYDGYDDSTIYSLSEWITFSRKEDNSLIIDNIFNSDLNDFHTPNNFMLNGKGISLDYVLTDIDGETRDTVNPDIGADEFNIDLNTFLDIEIAAIISPTNLTCENSNVVLSIKNNSLFPVNSFDIESVINGFKGNFTKYNTTIASKETIELPLINFEINKNTWYKKLEFFISNPNGFLDNNYNNNNKSITDVLQLDDLEIGLESNDCNSAHFLYIPNVYGINLKWSTGETTNRIMVKETGVYSVIITNINGCQITKSITIN